MPHNRGMRTWITADTHFGHRLVAGLRGFDTVWQHDETIVSNWNGVVAPNDIVYHLGDVAMSDGLDQVSRLNGRKILIAGNHDKCWHRHSKAKGIRGAMKALPEFYAAGFDQVYTSGSIELEIDGHRIVLSHMPVEGDHKDTDRYTDRRPLPGRLPVLCGHVHEAWRTRDGYQQLNVGLDVNGLEPILLDVAAAEVVRLHGIGAASPAVEGPWNRFGLA